MFEDEKFGGDHFPFPWPGLGAAAAAGPGLYKGGSTRVRGEGGLKSLKFGWCHY